MPDGQSLPAYNYKSQEVIFLAFKIFRKNCCGLDVHKTWIYACIGITDPNGRTEYKQARFSSFSKGFRELANWLAKYHCFEVCMESSGKYWIPVFNILEKAGLSFKLYFLYKIMLLLLHIYRLDARDRVVR